MEFDFIYNTDAKRYSLKLSSEQLALQCFLLDEFKLRASAYQQLLEQQREDLEVTLAEIGQHEARCRQLLSEDLNHGHDYDGVMVVNPFLSEARVE